MDAVNFSSLRASIRYEMNLSLKDISQKNDRISSIYETLRSKDVTLGKNFLIFVTFLKQIAPDLVEGFLDMVEGSLALESKTFVSGNRENLNFSFKFDLKIVLIEDLEDKGTSISTRLTLRFAFEFRSGVAQQKEMDPIVLDMNGDGIRLSGLNNPVYFDIDGDGVKERVSFVEGDDAFLFLDLNMNKFLDGGWELVGDNYGFKNGFEMLRAFDYNSDGKITPEDPIYSLLYIFQDLNKNRKIEPWENRSLYEARINEIDLLYSRVDIKLNETDKLIAISSYKSALSKGYLKVGDVMLSYLK